MLKATVLMDNTAGEGLACEWGLSVYIEYKGKKYLLDSGSTSKFVENAEKLGVSLAEVDTAVLSHAHYDHSGGYAEFFRLNRSAPLWVSAACQPECYFKLGPIRRYIGIPKTLLTDYAQRIRMAEGFCTLEEGVWLVPHIGGGLEQIGKKAHLYRRDAGRLRPDDFRHEQSLVFDTEQGLVVLNSCTHGGLQSILADIGHFLPGKRIYMTVGGLHLSKYSDSEVRRIAGVIRGLDIDRILTGHCTGERAFELLRQELGDRVQQTDAGLTVTVE